MKKFTIYSVFLAVACILVSYAVVHAATPITMSEHTDFLFGIIALFIGVTSFLSIRTLRTIDSNQIELKKSIEEIRKDMHQKIDLVQTDVDDVRHDFDLLKGSHDVFIKYSKHDIDDLK